MSMTDEVTFEAPAPAKRKKAKAKKKQAKTAAAPKTSQPYPGLTRTLCAAACGEKGCVISQKPYCAHPCKGGLQASEKNDPAALRRMQMARDQIDVRVDPNRFKDY